MRTGRTILVITALAIAALGIAFFAVGLERADQIASTIGGLTGVAGLGLSVWLWRTTPTANPAAVPGPEPEAPPNQPALPPGVNVHDSYGVQIGTNNTQHNAFPPRDGVSGT
jgi:hypothetical protein